MNLSPVAPAPTPKILIVDDNPANLVALKRLLTKVDAQVISASSGNQALALALDHDFVLILLDVQMPDIDGYEVANLLRGETRTSGIPIIFLTAAYDDDQHRLWGYAAGAVDYLEKPINETVLLAKVRVFLELRQKEELQRLMTKLEHANRNLAAEIELRRQSEAASQQLAHTIFAGTAEGVMVTDADGRVVAVNAAFSRMTEYTSADLVGQSGNLLDEKRHDAAFVAAMNEQLQHSGSWLGEVWSRRKTGLPFLAWLSVSAIRQQDGAIAKYVSILTDITQRKENEKRLWQQANFDALTGLPNRLLFIERLSCAIADAKRDDESVALLFLDIDRFKLVNDSLGHGIGDLLLQEAVVRMRHCLRENDTVARLSGDEFTIILKGVKNPADAAPIAQYLIDAMAQPFHLNGNEVSVGASVGISLFPQDADNGSSLLRNADMAMYSAKNSGRNAFAFFARKMDEHAKSTLRLSNDLRYAVERNELRVHYQPIVDAMSMEVVGAEALLRWQHPELGMVPPGEFIALAEDAGLIGKITEWVLRKACDDTVAWQRQALSPLRVSINLSARHRGMSEFIEWAAQWLDHAGLPRERVTFEITESFAIEESGKLQAIRDNGIGLAIDDFGTGYSSLSYLRRIPADTLKIDRSFVAGLGSNSDATMLVKCIIAIAHGLRMKVVAEGVETPEQLAHLRASGCNLLQGYYFSKPLPSELFAEFLKSGGSNPAIPRAA